MMYKTRNDRFPVNSFLSDIKHIEQQHGIPNVNKLVSTWNSHTYIYKNFPIKTSRASIRSNFSKKVIKNININIDKQPGGIKFDL